MDNRRGYKEKSGKGNAASGSPKGDSAGLWRNGVVLMAGAALLSKLIGALQKIPLQNMAGDRVFGIYNAVYPFYQLIMVLAAAGLPTAVSIVIATRIKEGRESAALRSSLIASLLLLGLTGVIAFALMWNSAGQIAAWIGDRSTIPAIKALSFALLLAPLAAALRGYMQGVGRMGQSALSAVAEQVIRVSVMMAVLGAGLAAGWSESSLAAGVMSGAVAGAAAALLLLAGSMAGKRFKAASGSRVADDKGDGNAAIGGENVRGNGTEKGSESTESGKTLRKLGILASEIRELAKLALPAALAAIVVPAIGVVDTFTVPRMLRGEEASEAMSLFGVYNRAQPLVQLVVMATAAAAAALVPGMVAAKADNRMDQLQLRLALLLRIAWLIGGAAALGLFLLAEPINAMLYRNAEGTTAFALIGCTALAGCVSAAIAPALQALGSARAPVALLLLAALLKGALNAVLVPSLGIEGAAFSGVVALSAAAMLGAAALRHAAAGLRPPHERPRLAGAGWRPAAGGIAALAVMAAALWLCERALGTAFAGLPPRAAATAQALTGVAVGACAFAFAALRCGVIRPPEWRALPGGEALAARLRRWRLIPPLSREG
ncbi:oligosaccharide flippase family protein [Paenibacillus sp. PAMC21692]|uniref:oligosaccharide flippase family protein n=1 Tax=Paenibacillus sp. PAMC21692 TaxID=2762320 RepID=UPI00164EB74F|nr:oligosaccharide flippase family protein [Paenibacillus sp. PAMC21692]QNK58101.1 oligosaccharide flippase family protein [Paenibacillus sp. PAMC21692]